MSLTGDTLALSLACQHVQTAHACAHGLKHECAHILGREHTRLQRLTERLPGWDLEVVWVVEGGAAAIV